MKQILTVLSFCFMSTLLIGQTISNVTPNTGERGTMQLPVTVSGTGTSFSNATSTVVRIKDAGGWILEVLAINNVTSTLVDFDVRIPNTAPLGDYTVSVYDSVVGDLIDLPNGFTVAANPNPPTLVGTTPEFGAINQVLPVTISVDNAHFDQATDNTIYLSQQGTSTILTPVPGTVTPLNGHFIKAMFDLGDASINIGSILNAHVENGFDGAFVDNAAIVVTDSTEISGTINYAGTYNGVVEIYQENVGTSPYTYSLVSTAVVGAANTFQFNGVANASYYVRSVPIGMNDVVATYYPAEIAWQNATLVSTDPLNPSTGIDISPVTSISLGGGVTVNGTLGYGPSGFFKMAVAVYAEEIEVFLKDVDNGTYAQSTTDQNGLFTFNGVPNGNYEIVVDLPGYVQVSTYNFTVDGSTTGVAGLDLLIDDGEIFTSNFLGLTPIAMEELEIYPNPASNDFYLKLPDNLTNVSIAIYDQLGKKVQEEEVPGTTSPIYTTNIATLSKGIYIVRVQSDQYNAETRLIKND